MTLPSPVRLTMRRDARRLWDRSGRCAVPRSRAKRAILVRSREPAITDHIRDQDRGDLAGFGHPSGTPALRRPSIRRSPIGLSN